MRPFSSDFLSPLYLLFFLLLLLPCHSIAHRDCSSNSHRLRLRANHQSRCSVRAVHPNVHSQHLTNRQQHEPQAGAKDRGNAGDGEVYFAGQGVQHLSSSREDGTVKGVDSGDEQHARTDNRSYEDPQHLDLSGSCVFDITSSVAGGVSCFDFFCVASDALACAQLCFGVAASPSFSLTSLDTTSGATSSPDPMAASDASGSAIPASASPSAFVLPGRSLSVLPIGLGVFGGVAAVALIVVALVTYERRKYRAQFQRRRREQQQQRVLAGMGVSATPDTTRGVTPGGGGGRGTGYGAAGTRLVAAREMREGRV
ncbi:hypothetical protein JCM11641_001898 [Rhodosporidiobolus odoratus]